MKPSRHTRPTRHAKPYIFLATLLFLSATTTISAQERVYIDTAGVGLGITIDGQSVRKLLRNVRLRTDRIRIDADSAYHFLDDAIIRAYGVRLENDKQEIIYADTLIHSIPTDDSSLFGRVILKTPDYTLYSHHVEVDGTTESATFPQEVLFRGDGITLRARSGFYNQQTDSAAFFGNVQLSDSTQYIEADSLLMNHASKSYHFLGEVYGEESENGSRFAGTSLQSDSTGFRQITGQPAWLMEIDGAQEPEPEIKPEIKPSTKPELMPKSELESKSELEFKPELMPKPDPAKNDTTHLLAFQIMIRETDSLDTMDAIGSVRIVSDRFSGIADTLRFRDPPETLTMLGNRGNPILWTEQIQLTGPLLQLNFENDNLRSLTAPNRPFATLQDSTTSRFHQMTGDTLQSWFEDGELIRISLFRQHQLLFHQTNENDEPDGLMTLVATERSDITFEDGEPSGFKAVKGIDGTYLPEQDGLDERKLDGFRWNPEMRPSQPILIRRRWNTDPGEPLFPPPDKYVQDRDQE